MFHQIKLVHVSAEETDGKLINNLDFNHLEMKKIYFQIKIVHREDEAKYETSNTNFAILEPIARPRRC